jgi:hypothetical protein
VYRLAAARDAGAGLGDVSGEDLALVAPHRMFTLRLDRVFTGDLDAVAEASGWRFLVTDEERVLASAETTEDNGEAVALNVGPYVSSTSEAIDELEQLPDVARGDFELRILKVPALYVVAAWLAGGTQILVPLAPAPSFLEPGKPYSEGDFLAALEEPARRILGPEGTGG